MVCIMRVMATTSPRFGDPRVPERFWQKIRVTEDGCWTWTGTVSGGGYGRFVRSGRARAVHREFYELLVGPIPEGLVIDHLCRNRLCQNPEHLEPVTNVENIMRGEGACARNARKTHCPQGHELSGENLYLPPSGSRHCRACMGMRDASLPQGVTYRNRAARRARHAAAGLAA